MQGNDLVKLDAEIYGPLLSTWYDQGCPHFLRNIHAPPTLRLSLSEDNDNDGVRLFSFNITTNSGELRGKDKEGCIHQRCVLVFLP